MILTKIVLVGPHFDFLGIRFHLVSTHVISITINLVQMSSEEIFKMTPL